MIPDNGTDGRNWRDDFQLTLHKQDEVHVTRSTGNYFLTNIHRVYAGNESLPSADDEDTMDYFLGKKPTGATTDSKVDLGMIARTIMKDLRLVSGYDALYPKVKAFIRDELFGQTVDLEAPNTLRNLSEPAATKTILETFKNAINSLTIQDKGDAEIRDTIKLRNSRPFVAKEQGFLVPKKSVFSKIIGDSPFELRFTSFLEGCDDIVSFAKNYMAVNFRMDYVKVDGNISNYYPDFIVKLPDGRIIIVETKGQEDLDVPPKMARLKQWCEDINRIEGSSRFDFVFVDDEGFDKYKAKDFGDIMKTFRKYKD